MTRKNRKRVQRVVGSKHNFTMAQLIMRRGPEPNKTYPLNQESVQIGRGAKNDIIIIDNEVSREHCRFVRNEQGYELFDLASSNGTFVNGQRVKESWVLPNECIVELGDSITLEYKYHLEDGEIATNLIAVSDEQAAEALQPSFLVVIAAHQPLPAVYPLEGEMIDVGRGTNNNVIIVEPEISRNHLRLTLSRRGYLVQDLGSTNGTSLNGVLLKEPQLLADGDVIRIGTTIVIRYTTNPQLFMTTRKTGVLETSDDTKEPTRLRRNMPTLPVIRDMELGATSLLSTGIEPGALVNHVLLLYARHDWESRVAPIFDRLFAADIPVWVDQYLTPGADDWQLAIEQARLECAMLIIVVTNATPHLDYIQKIWRHFHNREKPVLLVMVDEIERLPIGANKARKILYNPALPEASLQQIVNAVKQLRQ